VDEGSNFELSIAGAPSGASYAFDCGVGSGYGGFGERSTATCQTTDSGNLQVGGKVRVGANPDPEFTFTGQVAVANLPPTADFVDNDPVTVGNAATVRFTNTDDPSSIDTAAGFRYAFACDNGSLGDPDYQSAGTAADHACTFNEAGTYTVLGRIIDKNNGFNDYTIDVKVTDGSGGDTTPPTEPDLTLREAQAEPFQHVDDTTDTIFYNPGSQRTGAFTVIAATGDPESGVAQVLFPEVFGRDKGADADQPYKRQYTWNSADTASGPQSVTAVNGAGLEATAEFTVTPDREAPTVQIVSPAADARVSSGQVIEVEAEDALSGIESILVAYCSGTTCTWGRGNQIGPVVGDGPYQVTWKNPPKSGTYTLIARALDNVGNDRISAGVTVHVGRGTTAAEQSDLAPTAAEQSDLAPTQTASVTLAAPAAGATLADQATLIAEADAGDGKGAAVTKVTFQARSAKGGRWRDLGTIRAEPYERQVDLRNLDAGDYLLQATATDRKGRVVASEPVLITIVSTAQPPPGGKERSDTQDRGGGQREVEPAPDLPAGDLPMAEPSDGPPRGTAEQPYQLTDAGGAGKPGLARDGDPSTAWATNDAEAEANVWFDLGAKQPVGAVRWLQAKTGGVVELQLSTDRKRWKSVGRGGDLPPAMWQSLEIEGAARYVRFRYVATDGPSRLGFLAEVEVYGPKTSADEPRDKRATPQVGDAADEVGQTGPTDAKEAKRNDAKERAHDRPVGSEPNDQQQANNRPKDDHPARARQDGSRRRDEDKGGAANRNGNPPPTDSGQEPQAKDPPPTQPAQETQAEDTLPTDSGQEPRAEDPPPAEEDRPEEP
jgi:hypothetical protein